MKILTFQFQPSQNPLILELQFFLKRLILSTEKHGISDFYELRKEMHHQAALISLDHPVSEVEDISMKIRSSLTCEVLEVSYNGDIFVSLTSRKKEFQFAFKDLDKGRSN
ncbi:hypothetical protein [Mucilaginibacter endophyticus]|uniref:hypothetical protein n=1 Tax=Mucilaginibacter endophyticus TaxID=2675003 RepID=UPI000E0DD158|nr:hypothetical protein [Mucilaginibacter endophyticus]